MLFSIQCSLYQRTGETAVYRQNPVFPDPMHCRCNVLGLRLTGVSV